VSGEHRSPGRLQPRDVWTVLWVTFAFAAGLLILYEIRRILLWLFLAIFLAAVIGPAVSFLVRRGWRRGLAVAVVVVTLTVVAGGVVFVFVRPLVTQSIEFAEDLPENIERLREAPIVRQTLDRFNVEDRLEQVSEDLPNRLLGVSGPLFSIFQTIGETIIALVSIAVMTVFLLLYGPQFADTALRLIPDGRLRRRVDRLGVRSLGAVSGWVAGNVLTSVIAGVAALVIFVALGLPYATLLALWVAIADLIPLAGATLGAIPAIVVGFLISPLAGIVVTIFFVLYQQLENHVLQPAVYGRTIKLNPFLVLLAILVGVELAGFVGALLALPVAGIVQIVILDVLETNGHPAVSGTERCLPARRPVVPDSPDSDIQKW
jgi:predicted PurR-regulated permease PerM